MVAVQVLYRRDASDVSDVSVTVGGGSDANDGIVMPIHRLIANVWRSEALNEPLITTNHAICVI